jgi:glycine/D-amino acid oxidase-like deaminating enzyme
MYADDYAPECFWTLDAPLPAAPDASPPQSADVVIIGSGYTGLTAARETALAGRSTLVLDSGPIGGGCSARNGGQVAFSIKPGHGELTRLHGARVATRIYQEALEAVANLRTLARDEGLDCDWRDVGCFVGAHTPRLFGALVHEAESQPQGFEAPFRVVPRERQAEEIDTPFYHGGVVYPGDAAVHPAKLVRALHARAIGAGVEFRADCAVRTSKPSAVRASASTAQCARNSAPAALARACSATTSFAGCTAASPG